MSARSPHVVTGALLVGAALIANTAFVLLGSAFEYPDVLQQPGEQVLLRFHADAPLIGGLFALLAAGAALLAPIALRLARLGGPRRLALGVAVTGVAAAAVQVVGLLRWPLLVPSLAGRVADHAGTAEAVERFATLNTVLGQVIGETLGYLLTAAWTVLAVLLLRRGGLVGRASGALALVAVPLILAGLLVPLGVPGAGQANFAGYVLWSLWLISLGVTLLRARDL
ncbi:DUF4386 family protein [Kitasatospora sp. NPDC051853]|uniref:DUF4386 family protein n=1 Tax=Kitasatospora sp. NPDC051853 TaxID=3364058 RepID=UPI003799F808